MAKNISLDGLPPELWSLQDFYDEVMADLFYRHHHAEPVRHVDDQSIIIDDEVLSNDHKLDRGVTRRSRVF